ncbi:hypothetical protein FGADI_12034 [Fusarium gaditjirri]|uniref:Uncharacterized protein n=1 Tax=Fusarium gaditjirri TaxID=282569 RepID=A0A8H4STM9_9HYPO|nr:hypothetical protein FGADI_12034 [Fusarium gaditjirri]
MPLSSPLTEDGTPTTLEKNPASSFDSFILGTPSRMNHHSPLPTIEGMSTSDESPRYIPPLALGISSTLDKAADVDQPDNIAEKVTVVNVISSREFPKWLPIHSRQYVAAEQPDIVETIAREGKVYVLEHKEEKEMFKIRWNATTVNTSLSRPNNCYSISWHNDWFEGREEAIVGKVKVMEGFLRRPAYELEENGKFSDEGRAMVKNMCNVTLDSFQRNEESYGIPCHVAGAESLTITHTVVPEASVDVHPRQGQVDESLSQPEALTASADACKELEPPLEANQGGFRNKFKESCGNMKDKICKEPAEGHKNSAHDDEFLIALLGALGQDSDNTERPHGWSSLGVVWATVIFKRSVEPDAKKAS